MTEVIWAPDGGNIAVADHIAAVIARPGSKALALPGGATPAPIFLQLAARDLPWSRTTILPTDERLVSPGHRASNIGMLAAAFGATGAHLKPLAAGMTLPALDLIWLGMGGDGHVASLFPSTDPRADAPAGVVRVTPVPLPPEAPFDRLTLTLAAITAAAEIVLVLRGDAKRALLEAAIAGTNDLPIARLLAAATRPITIFWSPA